MYYPEIAEDSLGDVITDSMFNGELAHDGELYVVWAYGELVDGEWRVSSYASSNPYAPMNSIAKMWAEPMGDRYRIIKGRPADLAKWSDPLGEMVFLDE